MQLWNPFDNIGRQPDAVGVEMLDTSGPAMAVAAGLAMRSFIKGKSKSVNGKCVEADYF